MYLIQRLKMFLEKPEMCDFTVPPSVLFKILGIMIVQGKYDRKTINVLKKEIRKLCACLYFLNFQLIDMIFNGYNFF